MIGDREFTFRPVLTVCTLVALAILVVLGNWQLQRLEWKKNLISIVESRTNAPPRSLDALLDVAEMGHQVEYAPVRTEGAFVEGAVAPVFGTYDGAPGVFLFQLFQTEAGAIYVNRGFVPQSVDEAASPTPAGATEIAGLLRTPERVGPPASWFRRAGAGADGLWFLRDPEAMASVNGAGPVLPYYIDQYAVDGVTLPRGGTTRLDFRNKHLEYALTWFGLAGALFAVWVAVSLQPRE